MRTLYKTVCEVKWLHEYYLTLNDRTCVFDKNTQAARLQFLYDRFLANISSIHQDVDFRQAAGSSLTRDLQWRIIPSYAGFRIMARVDERTLGNGTVVYKPLVAPAGNDTVRVSLYPRKDVRRYSGGLGMQSINPYWYFSNNDIAAARLHPYLTSPVPNHSPLQNYLQGEITNMGGTIRCFLNNGALDPWQSLPGSRYASSADNILLPLTFPYRFHPNEGVTSASFTLKDSSNAVVHSIAFNDPAGLQVLQVNMHTENNTVNTLLRTKAGTHHLYKLEVTGNNGYTKTFKGLLFADDTMDIASTLGIVDLDIYPNQSAFSLLDASGDLQTRILPNGTKTPHPVFEIWMKSKYVFWKYYNTNRKSIQLNPLLADLVNLNAGVLHTQNPQPMTFTPLQLRKLNNTLVLLPNPEEERYPSSESGRYVFNIPVPESLLFPAV